MRRIVSPFFLCFKNPTCEKKKIKSLLKIVNSEESSSDNANRSLSAAERNFLKLISLKKTKGPNLMRLSLYTIYA